MVGWLAQESGPIQARFGSGENLALWLIFGVSLVALLFAWYLVREVLAAPEGTEKMREIARAIQEGAKAYLNRQYRTLAVFLAVLAVVLFFVLPVPKNAEHSAISIRFGRSIAFLLGALASMVTGYVGMWLAVRANVRTANAARETGLRRAVRRDLDPDHLQGRRHERAGRLRVRRRAARDVHAGRRRDLHEGGRRGRRPGRQGRAGDPGGRPAERRDDRRQRRGQRRRLRGDGRGSVRVLRGHPRRLLDPGRSGVQRQRGRRDRGRDVPALGPRDRRPHVHRRHPVGLASLGGRARDEGDQPGVLHLGRPVGGDRLLRLRVGHEGLAAVRGGGDRPDPRLADPGPHAVLHRREVQARAGDRGVDRHGTRDHDPVRLLRGA